MRICYNCTHMAFDTGSPDWSDVTPGSDGHMECYKGHWRIYFKESHGYGLRDDTPSLRECLETANHCPDYEHSTNAIELNIPDVDQYGTVHFHHSPTLSQPTPPVLLKTQGNGKILNIVHIKANHGGHEAGAIQIIVQKNDDTIITSRPFSLAQRAAFSLYNYLTYNLGLDIPKDDMFDMHDLVNQEVLIRDN